MKLFAILIIATCMAYGSSERILVLAPVCTVSHKYSFMPIIEALAEKGHQVTIVSPFKPRKAIENVKEIIIESEVFSQVHDDWFNMHRLGLITLLVSVMKNFRQMSTAGYDSLMANEEFLTIFKKRDVDLIIVDSILNDATLPIVDALNVPFIYHISSSIVPWTAAAMSVSPEYASVPFALADTTDDMSFLDRTVNVFASNLFLIIRRIFLIGMLDEYIKKDFPNARPISQIERDASLCITSDHPTTSWPRPLPPNVIPIGGLHVSPGRPLSPKFQNFVDESADGFIVFTLGTSIPVSSMPDETRRSFLAVFSKIPQRVIWKWEKAEMSETLPPNVLLVDWLPQNDLLAHPNARLIISHGGMLGIQEAVYHGVPMLGLPFGNDQRGNMAKLRKEGFALVLGWDSVNEQVLSEAIDTLLNNPSYRSNATRLSRLMRDEMIPGKDRAVYWVEHVLRHGGAKHLELSSKDMPFYQQYLLDVFLFMAVVVVLFGYLFLSFLRFTFICMATPRKQKVQ